MQKRRANAVMGKGLERESKDTETKPNWERERGAPDYRKGKQQKGVSRVLRSLIWRTPERGRKETDKGTALKDSLESLCQQG